MLKVENLGGIIVSLQKVWAVGFTTAEPPGKVPKLADPSESGDTASGYGSER